jgi:hypothetical protein
MWRLLFPAPREVVDLLIDSSEQQRCPGAVGGPSARSSGRVHNPPFALNEVKTSGCHAERTCEPPLGGSLERPHHAEGDCLAAVLRSARRKHLAVEHQIRLPHRFARRRRQRALPARGGRPRDESNHQQHGESWWRHPAIIRRCQPTTTPTSGDPNCGESLAPARQAPECLRCRRRDSRPQSNPGLRT